MNNITWNNIIKNEKKKEYFKKINNFIFNEIKNKKIIYPNINNIFNAFKLTNFRNIKIVILGQDPYYKDNQANGLAFSVNYGIKIPPSLFNIYKELHRSIKYFLYPNHGCLKSWAKQGILLLNRILTVEKNKPLSHINIGWETFTSNIIKLLNAYNSGIIFLIWGSFSKKIIHIIDIKKHFILISSHPSPLSVNKGFIGCNHFFKTNKILINQNKKIINWNL